MLCDDATEKDIHGKTTELPKDFAETRDLQTAMLRPVWQDGRTARHRHLCTRRWRSGSDSRPRGDALGSIAQGREPK